MGLAGAAETAAAAAGGRRSGVLSGHETRDRRFLSWEVKRE